MGRYVRKNKKVKAREALERNRRLIEATVRGTPSGSRESKRTK